MIFKNRGMKIFRRTYQLLVLTICTVTACSEEDIPGSPPTADAGEDIETPIDLAGTIVLTASGSTDPDGDTLSYQWLLVQQPDESNASINNDDEVNAFITPDAEGVYLITLEVDDGNYPPVTDEIQITITEAVNEPPTADAGGTLLLQLTKL